MHPVLWRWEWGGIGFRLGSYPFLVFCGVLTALLLVLARAREAGLSPRTLLPVLTAGILVGFPGARLASVLQTGGGGLVLYGGLFAGLLTGLLVAAGMKLPALEVADVAAPGVLPATAFGRIGCHLAGCCYGVVCDPGLSYPHGSHAFQDQVRRRLIGSAAAESLPTFPIVLIEAAVLLVLFLITSDLWRRRPRPGTVLGIAGILYPAWRFFAEFWRADNLPYWAGGLTFSQGISIAAAVVCGAFLILRRRQPIGQARPALEFRPASALQWLLFLAAPALSLGGISCGSHPNHEPHTAAGVYEYRKPTAVSGVQKPSEGKKEDRDSDDCFSDCVGDCTDDCIDDCTEAMCEHACSGGAPSDDESSQPALNSALGAVRPGQKYKGSLSIEAVVNKRLDVVLKLEGRFTAGKAYPDGKRPVRFRLRKVDLAVGDARWQGSGDVELEVGPLGDVR
ncbi:MAG TPA: prolipoprotein diacylglyceryl transferase family protein, partial [Planctomycetota bacterium]|nr:prolipoprotein diacylglyceryl transferase family protein [Planctomycetota bacterium]